jgi:Mg-chelatase subunit ChlD
MNPRDHLVRWRLVLGPEAEEGLGCGLEGIEAERDQALDFLYHREYGPDRNVRRPTRPGAGGGLEESRLTVPEWVNAVHTLFPRRTVERIERDALERYHLQELVTDPGLLARARPSQTLLRAVLHTKHLMNQEVLAVARTLVRQVIEQLLEKLARPVRAAFLGAADRRRRSHLKAARNFDARTTVHRNLAHYDPSSGRLFIRTPYFYSRVRSQADRWQLIVLVDESGSMADSVIHAAVTAAVFVGIRSLRTHLVLFDTSVVDVTEHVSDPVEAVMKVQLGGGTDIGGALAYAAQLVENPRRTIVVLITDFEEGGPLDRLYRVTRHLIESGVTVLGLAALDERAEPNYDRGTAERLAALGVHVAAMTPGELAEWVAQKVR